MSIGYSSITRGGMTLVYLDKQIVDLNWANPNRHFKLLFAHGPMVKDEHNRDALDKSRNGVYLIDEDNEKVMLCTGTVPEDYLDQQLEPVAPEKRLDKMAELMPTENHLQIVKTLKYLFNQRNWKQFAMWVINNSTNESWLPADIYEEQPWQLGQDPTKQMIARDLFEPNTGDDLLSKTIQEVPLNTTINPEAAFENRTGVLNNVDQPARAILNTQAQNMTQTVPAQNSPLSRLTEEAAEVLKGIAYGALALQEQFGEKDSIHALKEMFGSISDKAAALKKREKTSKFIGDVLNKR